MKQTLFSGSRTGVVTAPASKSMAHRLFIAAALGRAPVRIRCSGLSADVSATLACLRALGADIYQAEPDIYIVTPLSAPTEGLCVLPCGESGATLRFLLPVAGALGARAVFKRQGRLPQRPIAPLSEELCRRGMTIWAQGDDLYCQGRLSAGDFSLAGDVSSQFVSGLLLALPLLAGRSTLTLTSPPESAPYIAMTEGVLSAAGVSYSRSGDRYEISGRQRYALPACQTVEGDWSAAAVFLCAGALSRGGVTVKGLPLPTAQGDSAVLSLLRSMGAQVSVSSGGVTVRAGALRGIPVDARSMPDLIPPLCVLAAVAEGHTYIQNARRLRLKESDRLAGLASLLAVLGGRVQETPDGLVICGVPRLRGGAIDPLGDHRLAMAAALAALAADAPVTVSGSQCVQKSYPAFWDDFNSLKGETPCPAPSEASSV